MVIIRLPIYRHDKKREKRAMKAKTIEEIKKHLDLYEHYYPEIVVLCRNVAEYHWLKNKWKIDHSSHESYILKCLDKREEIVFFYDDDDVEGPLMHWQDIKWFDDINENRYIIVDIDLYKKWIAQQERRLK